MDARTSEERAWLGIGGLLVLGAALANEFVLAAVLSPDGAFEAGSLWAIRALQVAGAASGVVIAAQRGRLARWVAGGSCCTPGPSTLRNILIGGIALRMVVFAFLQPTNNDPHWEFIRFIIENGRLPIADELILGFQPPLYYLAAVPFAIGASLKLTQAFSLALSIANLVLIHRVLRETRLLSSWAGRCHALLFAAILPQFVIFSSFVSNDALAFPLGTMLTILAIRYVERPTRGGVLALGVVQGLALLTKGTLIGFAPVLVALIVASEWRKRGGLAPVVASVALFGITSAAVGCYKFVHNQIHFGTPVVGNDILKQEWVEAQAGTYQGVSSLVDINVLKLARYPYSGEKTRHSIPLLLYGTFWTAYIKESNFNATRRHPYKLVVRVLYLAGVVPTLLLFAGAASCAWRNRALAGRVLVSRTGARESGDESRLPDALAETAALLVLACTFALIVKWGLKHDAWSFFQARLAFPAFLSIALCYGWGFDACTRRGPFVRYATSGALGFAYVVIAAYYAIEIADRCC